MSQGKSPGEGGVPSANDRPGTTGKPAAFGEKPQAAFLPSAAPAPFTAKVAKSSPMAVPDLRRRGLILGQREGVRPELALRAHGLIDDTGFAALLAEELAVELVDLDRCPPDANLLAEADPAACLACRAIPWREEMGHIVHAVADPVALNEAGALPEAFVIAPAEQIRDAIHRMHADTLVERAETLCPNAVSCRGWLKPTGAASVFIGALLVGGFALAFPSGLALAIVILALMTLSANISFRLLGVLARLARHRPKESLPLRPQDLPTITLMVPLHRENGTLRQLIAALEALHYPASGLQILLVTEADDAITRASLSRYRLPANARVVSVPPGTVKTKPRALNFALPEAQGEIVGVLDAEDRPEPDQLLRIAKAFASGGEDLACVQGTLDFYNARENWIARCFAIEYAIWFRIVLPALARFRLPIPLGGTTMYVRRDVLEAVGGWDAHNVTEDADLGLRLARAGWRTDVLPTTTFEEANHRPWPWIRQRSRWLKGYTVTWGTHMRRPREAWRALGWRGFIAMNAHLAGTIFTFALAPLYWSMWMEFAGIRHPLLVLAGFPSWSGKLFLAFFVGSACVQYLAGFLACQSPHLRHLRWWLPSLSFYWPMASLALLKAMWELPFRPCHWDKTEHGVSRHVQGDNEIGSGLKSDRAGVAVVAHEGRPQPAE